jgi:hypothetical protein
LGFHGNGFGHGLRTRVKLELLQNRLDESPIFLLVGVKEGFHFPNVASTGDVEETAAAGALISILTHRIGGLAEAISG